KYVEVTDCVEGSTNGVANYDTILDFDTSGGSFNHSEGDQIDLTAFPSGTFIQFKSGDVAAGTIAAHTIAWHVSGTETIIYANPTGGPPVPGQFGLSRNPSGGPRAQDNSGLLEIHRTGQYTGATALVASDFLVTGSLTTVAPAGIAGAPINLGLTDVSHGDMTSVAIGGLPAGWALSSGT